MSLRLSPKETMAVKVPGVVGAPEGEPLPGTSGSLPPQAASSRVAATHEERIRMTLMRVDLGNGNERPFAFAATIGQPRAATAVKAGIRDAPILVQAAQP